MANPARISTTHHEYAGQPIDTSSVVIAMRASTGVTAKSPGAGRNATTTGYSAAPEGSAAVDPTDARG